MEILRDSTRQGQALGEIDLPGADLLARFAEMFGSGKLIQVSQKIPSHANDFTASVWGHGWEGCVEYGLQGKGGSVMNSYLFFGTIVGVPGDWSGGVFTPHPSSTVSDMT